MIIREGNTNKYRIEIKERIKEGRRKRRMGGRESDASLAVWVTLMASVAKLKTRERRGRGRGRVEPRKGRELSLRF